MKHIILIVFCFCVIQSCYTSKIVQPCQYTVILTDEMIELAENKQIIWLSSYKGVKGNDLKDKITIGGMYVDFPLSIDNLKSEVFDNVCMIKNNKLDSVIFNNTMKDNRLYYTLMYVKLNN